MDRSGYGATISLTRTADANAYLAGDIIGVATGSTAALTFDNVGMMSAEMMIASATLLISDTALISGEANYTLHLYNVTPPSALGDNAPWDLPAGDRASYLGFISLGTPVDKGSSLFIQQDIINHQLRLLKGSIFGYLVTDGAYTPSSARVYRIGLRTISL